MSNFSASQSGALDPAGPFAALAYSEMRPCAGCWTRPDSCLRVINPIREAGSKCESDAGLQTAIRFGSCLKLSELAFLGPQTIKLNIIRNKNDKGLCK